jgi:hypothetical protein
LLAALLLGIADVAGKYYVPKLGAFIVYTLMIAILIWRPQGLFVRQGGKLTAGTDASLLGLAGAAQAWECALWLRRLRLALVLARDMR